MSLKFFGASAAAVLALLMAGCGGKDPRAEAREVLDVVYERIGEGNFEGVLEFYSKPFLEATPPESWISTLESTNRYFGKLESYEILQTLHRWGSGEDSGMHVIFHCRVRYEKDSVREEVVLVRPREGGDFRVKGHAINPALIPKG